MKIKNYGKWVDVSTVGRTCASVRCQKARRENGRYCSDNCATAVRMRRKYKRDKAGIRLKNCPMCKGSGKVTR